MRVSETDVIAEKGYKAVELKFTGMGWNPVRYSSQDLGTDLLVEVRDFRRYNRGLIVGVQVKSGPSWFREPGTMMRSSLPGSESQPGPSLSGTKRFWSRLRKRVEKGTQEAETEVSYERSSGEVEDKVSGWWFREAKADHFDDWAAHSLPHILVLYDDATEIAYWVHVRGDEVESTKKGCKIFVPEEQTLDSEHAEDLYRVACKQKAAPAIEGTVFLGAKGGIPPARRWRHALIAPRLVAPHPNAGFHSKINAAEAVALLAQGRFTDLLYFANENQSVHDPRESPPQRWDWRFVAAMWEWVMNDSTSELRAAFESALKDRGGDSAVEDHSKEAAAASGVLLACALHQLEEHREALSVLDGLVNGDVLSPVDHGWVLVQRARMRIEIGDLAGAREDSVIALRSLAGDEDDLTVSALAAAATRQLFATADHVTPGLDEAKENDDETRGNDELQRRFVELLTTSDTAVSWWRSQTLAWGLNAVEAVRFKSWSQENSQSADPQEYPGLHHLFAAELSADVTGEHSSWKAMSALTARQRLMGGTDADRETVQVVEGLDALRRSGDHRSLKSALGRLRHNGPVEAVVAAMEKIPVSGWTHTTADTNFAALAAAGDLLSEDRATEHLHRCTRLVQEPGEMTERLRPSGSVPYFAFEAAEGLLAAAGRSAHNAMAELISPQVDLLNWVPTRKLAGAVWALEFGWVDAQTRDSLWELAIREKDELSASVLGWFAANDYAEAEPELKIRIGNGDTYALAALGDVTKLDRSQAVLLIAQHEERIREQINVARKPPGAFGGFNACRELALLNLKFGDDASWGRCIEMVCDPAVAWNDKRATCLLMAELSADIPPHVQDTLIGRIDDIAEAGIGSSDHMGGAATVLAIVLGALDGEAADTAVAAYASGSPEQRQDIATLLGFGHCHSQQPILSALVDDPHPLTRYNTAKAVGRLVSAGANEPIQNLARHLTKRDGTLLPVALLRGLMYFNVHPSQNEPLRIEIAQRLEHHRSGQVRNKARTLLS